jgi:hypothetical protein
VSAAVGEGKAKVPEAKVPEASGPVPELLVPLGEPLPAGNVASAIPEWDAEAWKDAVPVVLEVGKQYAFKGKFRQFSDTGFAHEDGLLEFASVQQVDRETGVPQWVDPPGAPWHPINIARMEAGRLELEARARKAHKK